MSRKTEETISLYGMAEILKATEKVRKEAFFAGLLCAGSKLDGEEMELVYDSWIEQREMDFERYRNPGTVDKRPKIEDVELPENDYPSLSHE